MESGRKQAAFRVQVPWVFFDWNGDGISDHVGIVEKYEGGIIYTVEGNTGTNIGGNNVRGVWKHSYSVGSATILGYGII